MVCIGALFLDADCGNRSLAHSNLKFSGVDGGCPKGLKVQRSRGQAQLGRRLPARKFARLGIAVQGDGVQICLAVHAQVRALGQRAAQHAVGVLVDAPLPRALRVCKVHLDVGADWIPRRPRACDINQSKFYVAPPVAQCSSGANTRHRSGPLSRAARSARCAMTRMLLCTATCMNLPAPPEP